MKVTTILRVLALAFALALPVGASAAFIDGTIDIGGDIFPTCSGGPPCDLSNADGLDFDSPADVLDSDGDLAVIAACMDCVTMTDITDFSPLTPSPVDPLWSVGGFSFALTSLTVGAQGPGNFLFLTGDGVLSGAGFDDTNGTWTFSAQGNAGQFSFSSTTATPEPGILALLALGLVGFGVTRRRRS